MMSSLDVRRCQLGSFGFEALLNCLLHAEHRGVCELLIFEEFVHKAEVLLRETDHCSTGFFIDYFAAFMDLPQGSSHLASERQFLIVGTRKAGILQDDEQVNIAVAMVGAGDRRAERDDFSNAKWLQRLNDLRDLVEGIPYLCVTWTSCTHCLWHHSMAFAFARSKPRTRRN